MPVKKTLVFLSILIAIQPAILNAQIGATNKKYPEAEFRKDEIELYDKPHEFDYDWVQHVSGTEGVEIIDEEDDWYQVRLRDDRVGWVKADCIHFAAEESNLLPDSTFIETDSLQTNRLYSKIYVEPVDRGSGQVSESGSIYMSTHRGWIAFLGSKQINLQTFLKVTGYTSELEAYNEYRALREERSSFGGAIFLGALFILGVLIAGASADSPAEAQPSLEDKSKAAFWGAFGIASIFVAIFYPKKNLKEPTIPYSMACDMAADYNAKQEMNKADDDE